ncbi:MAG: EFR1 family ferrodoxin [Thermoplasmata archaeon]|nr:MAG: EFR1 family ferrodoxin [Thermoplasmata archaeon]
MKGIICYYSGTGNTKLACKYIAAKMNNVDIDLFNIVKDGKPNLDKYDIVGFACFTDFGGPSYIVQKFIEGIPQQKNKPAFVFNTYGFMSGKTQGALVKWISAKGFLPIAGHTLHVPESYPPMIVRKRGAEDQPSLDKMESFNRFISNLDGIIKGVNSGSQWKKGKIKGGLFMLSRTKAKKDMGDKFVDLELCNECGVCEKVCPYNAVSLDPKPKFDMNKCYGCWGCFHKCPKKVIYTRKFRGEGHYPKPNAQLKEKLKIIE